MGRQLLTGALELGITGSYTLLDLLHYAAPGTRVLTAGTAGFLSVDAGSSSLGALNTVPGGDAGDWASSVANDAFDAFGAAGTLQAVTANDLAVLDAIGWDPMGSRVAPGPMSGGVEVSMSTGFLASAQVNKGLAAGAALIGVAPRTGSPGIAPGDSFSFALGGAAAASFALTQAGDTATIAVGGSAVAARQPASFTR